jgi:hypothetical protein
MYHSEALPCEGAANPAKNRNPLLHKWTWLS